MNLPHGDVEVWARIAGGAGVILLAMLAGCTHAAGAPTRAGGGGGGGAGVFSLSIAVPEREGQRALPVRPSSPPVYVVLRNESDAARKVWSQGCSWGAEALSFEVAGQDGKVAPLRRTPAGFLQNMPIALTLQPGDTMVLTAELGSDAWAAIKEFAGKKVRLRAVYEVKKDAASDGAGVWVGRVESGVGEYVVEGP